MQTDKTVKPTDVHTLLGGILNISAWQRSGNHSPCLAQRVTKAREGGRLWWWVKLWTRFQHSSASRPQLDRVGEGGAVVWGLSAWLSYKYTGE